MNVIKLKYKFPPGLLERGYFPDNFDILKNSTISIQYVYLAMAAAWNELEFLKLRELMKFSVKEKAVSFTKLEEIFKHHERINYKLNPLILRLIRKLEERSKYLEKKETEVVVDDRKVKIYTLEPGEGLYIPFSDEIFAWTCIKDEKFCNSYHISRSSLSTARKKLKELNLINYNSEGLMGQKMTCFTFIPPIKEWIEMPSKIFYLKDLSRSSKVILFWIKKYLKKINEEINKEINIDKLNRKNFMEISGFKNEKTLRRLRRELIPLFPSCKDLFSTLL